MRKRVFYLFSIAILFLCFTLSMNAQSSSTFSPGYIPGYIGNIDNDGINDAIMCQRISGDYLLPRRIAWGEIDTNASSSVVFTSSTYTTIEYPDWAYLRGSFFVTEFNRDTVNDLIIKIYGVIEDSTENIDTSRFFAIFGHDCLRGIDTIFIDQIDTLQNFPFYAKEINEEYGLSDPQIRNRTGYLSYLFNKVYFTFNSNQAISPTDIKDIVAIADDEFVKIYPNPTDQFTTIEIHDAKAGAYYLRIISLEGQDILQLQFNVESPGIFSRVVDLSNFSNGYYSIVIRKDERLIGNYPIVIIH